MYRPAGIDKFGSKGSNSVDLILKITQEFFDVASAFRSSKLISEQNWIARTIFSVFIMMKIYKIYKSPKLITCI